MLLYHFDKILLIFLLIFAIKGYRKGFILSVFGFLPFLGALIGTKILNPVFNKFLRGTFIFEKITNFISEKLDFSSAITNAVSGSQTEIINNMKIPDFLKVKLIENNNSVVHEVLDTSGIQDYITKFLANGILNILCIIILFVGIYLIIKLIIRFFDTATKLPGLNFLNRVLGMIIGILKGIIIIWFVFTIMFFFIVSPAWQPLFEGIQNSILGKLLYDNNMLLAIVLSIFT